MRSVYAYLLASGAALAMSACSGGAGPSEAVGQTSQAATATPFYYLRCNNTDWGADQGSLMQSTGDPDLFVITVNAKVLSDVCSLTQVIATSPDSWGTSQTFFTTRPGQTLAVPGTATLIAESSEVNFPVSYPTTGAYAAAFNPATNTLAIAPSGTIEGRLELAAGAGVAGTVVRIAGPSGGVVGTAVTNANGAYQVSNLAPASYTVSFAATPSGAQPSYTLSATQPMALLGGTASLDATCSPATVGCTAGPVVTDPFHQLLVVDPNVTNPSVNPQASNATDGHFSFRYVLETLSGCPNAATNDSCVSNFVKNWLNTLGTPQVVNTYTVPARISSVVVSNWPTLSDGSTLDLSQAPFQLLAIVNRTDLHTSGQGEGRLVYGFQEAGVFQLMTVIVEFLLPSTPTLPSRNAWVNAFFGLPTTSSTAATNACASSTNPACVFGYNLQKLTDQFISAAQLNDLRTNDFVLAPPCCSALGQEPVWAWRQFDLASSAGVNELVTAATPETPDFTLDNDPNGTLGAFINPNATQVRDGFISVPSFLVGGQAEAVSQPNWNIPSVDPTTLQSFSGRTCNGCHFFIGTGGQPPPAFHIAPAIAKGDGTNLLSLFVTLVEIPRRESFMSNQIACGGAPSLCAAGVDVALTQF